MKKITPFLWFDGNVREIANYYRSIFKNVKVTDESRMGEGALYTSATIDIEGQELILFNGGPYFKLNESCSMFVNCETQAEIDELYEKLSEGGVKQQCGWVKDKFGLSWQIIPPILGSMLQDKDPAKAKRVTDAMLKMHKIDIATLKQAYEGEYSEA